MALSSVLEAGWEGLRAAGRPETATLVLLGASGDLSRRMLLPALYRLFCQDLLPSDFQIAGMATRPWRSEDFRQVAREALAQDGRSPMDRFEAFAALLTYQSANLEDPVAYRELAGRIAPSRNLVFYLSLPPLLFDKVVTGLKAAGLGELGKPEGAADRRIVVEKPFGTDLHSARDLNALLLSAFPEEHIFRMDHFLGKDAVQNILMFRTANEIIEPIWNRRHVDHVQITVAESLGIESRGKFYEKTGVVRDMLQNHLASMLALIALEPPMRFDSRSVRDAKLAVLEATSLLSPDSSVAGQYQAGQIAGDPVPGYRQEDGVDPGSTVPTYVATRAQIDNWRWAGVPFFLRTGKRMAAKVFEVRLRLRSVPKGFFRSAGVDDVPANWLVFRMQPTEGISLVIQTKAPGYRTRLRELDLEAGLTPVEPRFEPQAYEVLLLDVLVGDTMMFLRADEIERAWNLVAPLLEPWPGPSLQFYRAGTWGPQAADDLVVCADAAWRSC